MSAQRDNDTYQKHPLPDDFPISTLGSYRENLVAPAGPFDARGSWTQVFGIHSTGTGSSRVGRLVLGRRVGGDGRVALSVRHEKQLTGSTGPRKAGPAKSRRVLEAVLDLGDQQTRLSTPRQWHFRTQVFEEQGRPIPDAGLRRQAIVEEGRLRVTTGDAKRTYPLAGEYTVNWALFDAAARLPREPFDPIDFTLIDHFDQVKPEQRLVFRRVLDTAVAGRDVRLYGFDQTGRGVMPWTYWVDEEGRAVVVLSGLETYILESTSEGSGSKPPA
jgi:hypothetical protein